MGELAVNNVYEECPIIENDRFLLRFVTKEDSDAFSKYGFEKSESMLEGTMDHYLYKDYWKILK